MLGLNLLDQLAEITFCVFVKDRPEVGSELRGSRLLF